MLKAFKYRLYPTIDQSVLLNKHIGSARFVYNLALETRQTAYAGYRANLVCFDLIKQLPDLKKECEWLKEINSQSLQDREWTCNGCNTLLDRDVNASINIKNFALKNHLSVGRRLKNRNELSTLVGVMTSEALRL